MSPAYLSKFAERAFPVRWWLGASSVLGLSLVAVLASFGGLAGVRIATLIAGPLIGLPWAAFCAVIWFHPSRGNFQPTSRIVGKLPKPMQTGIRWYAAFFLSILFLVCAVGWPLVVITGR